MMRCHLIFFQRLQVEVGICHTFIVSRQSSVVSRQSSVVSRQSSVVSRQSSVVSRQFNKYLTKHHSLQQLYKSFMMLAFAVVFLTSGQVMAACTSNASGNWSASGTWINCGGVTPSVGDDVVINTAVSLSANAAAKTVIINATGTLAPGANTLTITPTTAGESAAAFVNNGTFNATGAGGRVVFAGDATVSGSSATVFDNLDIDSFALTLPSTAPLASIIYHLGGTGGATSIAGTLKFINTFSPSHTLKVSGAAAISTLDLSGLTTGNTIDVNPAGSSAAFTNVTGGDLGTYCVGLGTPILGTASPCTVTSATNEATTHVIIYSDNGNGSGNHTGNLGGRTGADAFCAASTSKPAGFTSYRALISVDGTDQILDMPTKYSIPALPLVGNYPAGTRPAIVANWAALLNGTTLATTMQLATGATNHALWTGSNANGTIHADNCSGWTDGTASFSGRVGAHNQTASPTWISAGSDLCNAAPGRHLLCVAFTPVGASNTVSAPLFSTKEKAKVFSEEVK
jgi:hypothetical protein